MANFRIEIEVTNGDRHIFEDIPAEDAQRCVRVYTTEVGDGLTFVRNTTCDVFFWPWDEIASCKVSRQIGDRSAVES